MVKTIIVVVKKCPHLLLHPVRENIFDTDLERNRREREKWWERIDAMELIYELTHKTWTKVMTSFFVRC